jgi:DNA-directed RNA polymerase specialized sigma24 family protein
VSKRANPTAGQRSALQRVRDAEGALERARSERVQSWYAARQAGLSDRDIAQAAGLSVSTVAQRLGPRGSL